MAVAPGTVVYALVSPDYNSGSPWAPAIVTANPSGGNVVTAVMFLNDANALVISPQFVTVTCQASRAAALAATAPMMPAGHTPPTVASLV